MLRRAFLQVASGLILGLGAAWWAARAVKTLLFHVEPHALWPYATVGLVLTVAGLAAAWIPARRAARVDPLVALRLE